jgi:putative pyruvate formate lyase activating enzyme
LAAYLELYHSGKLRERIDAAVSLLESCSVCPRSCGVNRLAADVGKCHTAHETMVSSYGPHFGEEAPLVGRYGSGTIFSLIVTLDACSARILPLAS